MDRLAAPRRDRSVAVRRDEEAKIGERGDAERLRMRRIFAHHGAVHVRSIGEMQHQPEGSALLGRVAAHSVNRSATITGTKAISVNAVTRSQATS